MKILDCPLNGPRNISEFTYGGELAQPPDPWRCTARDWAAYLFFEDNDAGVVTEWWCHTATAYWFLAERDTRTDEIVRTFPASEIFKQRVDYDRPPDGERG